MIAQLAKPQEKSIGKRYTDQQVYDIINKYYGNKSLIIAALQCTMQQLEVWLRKPERKEVLVKSRDRIVDKSEKVMLQLLDSEDDRVKLETAKFLLTKLGRSYGYCGDAPSINIGIQGGNDTKVAIQSIFGINE